MTTHHNITFEHYLNVGLTVY